MTNESITEDFSGKSRLISNVLTSWVSQIFLILTGFFLPRVIDQQLGQDVLGLWDFAWSIISYLSLPGLGIGSSLNKYVADYRAKSETENLTIAVSTVVFIQAILAFVIVVGTVVIANNVHWIGSDISHIFPETPMIILLLGMSRAGFEPATP